MNDPRKQQSYSDREVDDQQQPSGDSSPLSNGTSEVSSAPGSGSCSTRSNRNDIGLADRLTDFIAGDGDRDSDLLMQRNTVEGTVVQWLQALDMQVMGACRADERLKPLLKLNVSSVAEDRLLSHLSQHFEPSEVGLLARCLCIPLVSICVGKINKQGTLLIPTSTRGNLVLSLLPTSDLRLSFLADDGYAERLATLRSVSDCSSVVVEGIPADSSGRSFVIKIPDKDRFHFWCSEKSRLLGNELLEKMKNLLERKPSLAELTGISDSRLQRFVDHLRTYLVGSTTLSNNTAAEASQSQQSPPLSSKPPRVRNCSIQGSLSPRPSSFKEGVPRNIASLRNVVRDKLRRRAEGGRVLSCVEVSEKHHHVPSPSTSEPSSVNTHQDKKKLPESSYLFPSLPESLSPSLPPIASTVFSPYYCWCPPVQYTVAHPHLIPASTAETFTLPPLSPNLSEIPLPPFLPLSMPVSQLSPLMCDPIVHIPLIDICSSAYLVSGSPEESDSEKSARDTLRLLVSGSSQFPSGDMACGSRGFYGATADVNAIANGIAAMGLVTPGVMRRCIEQGDVVEEPGGTSCSKDDDGIGSSEE